MTQDQSRHEATVLGKVIGTFTGWDQADTYAIILFDVEVNETGRAFLRTDPGMVTLTIDFGLGTVKSYDDKEQEVLYRADWSVFNNDEKSPA